MKYIKLYESFETDLEDILLEITDLGYDYILFSTPHRNIIQIYKNETIISLDEVKDCLLRLKDYLDDKYIECKIYYSNEFRWESLKLKEDMSLNGIIGGIEFYYK